MFLRGRVHGKTRRVLDYRDLPAILRHLKGEKVLIIRKMPGGVSYPDVIHIWVTRVRHPDAVSQPTFTS